MKCLIVQDKWMTSNCWECTTHCLSLHFFSLNLFAWAHNSNQKSETDHCLREHLNVSHQLMPTFCPSLFHQPRFEYLESILHRFDFLEHMCLKVSSFCPHFLQRFNTTIVNIPYDSVLSFKVFGMLEGWRAAITVGTNDGPLTRLSNRYW